MNLKKIGKKSLAKISLSLLLIFLLVIMITIPNLTRSDFSGPKLRIEDSIIHGSSWSKKVTVYHDEDGHYYDVSVSTSIPENLIDVELYRYITSNMMKKITNDPAYNFQVVDINGNGLTDTVKWIVPELLEASFIVEGKLVKNIIPIIKEPSKKEEGNETKIQLLAEVGKAVKWKMRVEAANESLARELIPKDAKNIITGVVATGIKTYEIEYETPAPFKEESIIKPFVSGEKYRKRIIVKSNFSEHYEDVKAFADIPEELSRENYIIRLYHIIDGSKTDVTDNPGYTVLFVDSDGNSFIDKIEWAVPQLSEQEFEIEADLTIINVQSYPTVGGNWTVRFTTTGTANLTITAVDGTEFGRDIEFLELRCGDNVLTNGLTDEVVFVENYSCYETGYEISKVLISGKHVLEFRFGGDVEYAYNSPGTVVDVPPVYAECQINGGGYSSGNCDGQYSEPPACVNELIWCDESGSNYEQHMYTKSGGDAGIIATYNDSSVTDCESIRGVYVIYQTWSSATGGSHETLVDADGDGFTRAEIIYSVSGTEPSSNTTLNVTDLSGETWDCADFFGSSATARIKVEKDIGTGKPTDQHQAYWDIVIFQVDYIQAPDSTPTIWSNPNVNVTNPNRAEPVNISVVWEDSGGADFAWLATNETGAWKNYTDGTYGSPRNLGDTASPITVNFSWINQTGSPRVIGWKVYANDTSGNENGTNIPSGTFDGNFTMWGWSNITWTSPSTGSSVSGTVDLTCFVNDTNTTGSGNITGYDVYFYNETTTASSYLGVNYTNSSGHALWQWDTTGLPAETTYYPKCNITDNSTLYYNASEYYEENTTVTISACSVAIGLTNPLADGIIFGNVNPENTADATGNNGASTTDYNVTVSISGCSPNTVDVYIKADGNLINGSYSIPLSNEKFRNSTSDSAVPATLTNISFTTNYANNKVGLELSDGSKVHLKYLISVPSTQEAGYYKNTIYIKGVRSDLSP